MIKKFLTYLFLESRDMMNVNMRAVLFTGLSLLIALIVIGGYVTTQA